jgi:hypothetical protein
MRINPGIGTFDLTNCEISLYFLNINYSFPSILVPTRFSINWLGTIINIPLTVGDTYSASDLNALLIYYFTANLLYLVNEQNNALFYGTLEQNTVSYALQWNASAIPTAAQAAALGLTQPAGASWSFPATASIPLLITNVDTGNFTFLTGFPSGTFPSITQSTPYRLLSTRSPELSPYSSILINCRCVNEMQNIPPNQIGSFGINVRYGQNINVSPFIQKWYSCNCANVSFIDIFLTDQYGNPLQVIDPNWSGQISVRTKPKKESLVYLG